MRKGSPQRHEGHEEEMCFIEALRIAVSSASRATAVFVRFVTLW
jgi:hypothetical protein